MRLDATHIIEWLDAATPADLAAFHAAYDRAAARLRRRFPSEVAEAKERAAAIVRHAQRIPEHCGSGFAWALCDHPECDRRCRLTK